MPSTANVGFIDLVAGEMSAISVKRHPKSVNTIRAWAMSNAYDAVIWTALGIKFKETTGVLFSVVAALSYLQRLTVLVSQELWNISAALRPRYRHLSA